jgi:vacuolar-type H+-ATPase subunit D/Vma8
MNNIDFEEALKRKREYLIMGIKTMLRDSKFIKDENRNELADEYFEKCYSPFASDHTQLQFINYAISQLFMHD